MSRSILQLAGLLSSLAVVATAHGACAAASGARRLPLVELYTAEGCSECPAADRWLSTLARRPPGARPALLALHVDYWDDIGWRDPYSAALHGQRQAARVMLAGKRVVVTPQVMVGERVLVDWRDPGAVAALLSSTREPAVDLSLRVTPGAEAFDVAFDAALKAPAHATQQPLLWLALYQDGLQSHVTAGENRGATLRHDRVVRTLQGPWPMEGATHRGRVRIPRPGGAAADAMGIVLFAESSRTGDGLQALELPLSACDSP